LQITFLPQCASNYPERSCVSEGIMSSRVPGPKGRFL
jgi:hypothetical protein